MALGPGFSVDGSLDVAGTERPGATIVEGGVRFEVWAPRAGEVEVEVYHDDRSGGGTQGGERHPLIRLDAGVHAAIVRDAGPGTRYRFRLDGGAALADPASRWQPDGVFGASAVLDPAAFTWNDAGWTGVELADTVLYELHVGTFTRGGTLDSAIEGLPRLAALGVTTVELMPLSQFSGRRGWGYDGVFPNAVQHSYGGPGALARFVDAAHATGLSVVVDAVYNHLGPEGNVFDRYAPYMTDEYSTTWGRAINFAGPDSDQVRRLFVDNARTWIDDFHCDGLRLDAVDAIVDQTARPFLEELIGAVHQIGERTGRTVLTFAESAANDPRMLAPPPAGFGGDAQWNDEYHHALRVALTGDRSGYYVDFTGVDDVAAALRHRFVYRGQFSAARGRRHGRDVSRFDDARFVVFDQNHDQIGNRRDGERLGQLVGFERRKLALAAVLLSPFTPMLFQGEEYGDPAPFPYFVDHQDPALLEAVRSGRAEEFSAFAWTDEPPDPGSIETFESAILQPDLTVEPRHAALLSLTTELLRLRRDHPALTDPGADVVVARHGETVTMRRVGDETTLLSLHFGDGPGTRSPETSGDGGLTIVLDTADQRWDGPGDSAWSATLAVGR
jgi:maltooligosyltrehalose trehalohydrolase